MAGGLLTDWVGWRSVMLVNVPVVAAALLASRRGVPVDRRTGPAPRLDISGALLVTAGAAVLVLGLVRTETYAWGSGTTLGTLGAAAVLLGAFVAVEARKREPLLRLGLLGTAHRPVLSANVFSLLMSSGQFAAFYFTSLYLQDVMGYGPTAAGAAFLPFCAGVVAGSTVATRLIGRAGERALLVAGGLLGAAGFGWFALAVEAGGTFLGSILGPSLVASVGIGLCFVPLGTAATSGVAPEETGMASGLLNSSRQLGGSLGLAVLVTVARTPRARARTGPPSPKGTRRPSRSPQGSSWRPRWRRRWCTAAARHRPYRRPGPAPDPAARAAARASKLRPGPRSSSAGGADLARLKPPDARSASPGPPTRA